MTRRHRVVWPPLALLLLHTPGCWCLHSPRMVTGPVGGSLSVPCPYKEEYADDVKYWCKDSWLTLCRKTVETSGSEREGRSGRVSIRDHPAKLTFTVTLENLTEEDAGTYWCGIDRHLSFDPKLQVEVSVSPAPSPSPSPEVTTSTPGSQATLSASPSTMDTQWESLGPSQHPSSLLGSVHFWLPVLLKVPLLLSLLGAVLWVSRPERGAGGRQRQPDDRSQ